MIQPTEVGYYWVSPARGGAPRCVVYYTGGAVLAVGDAHGYPIDAFTNYVPIAIKTPETEVPAMGARGVLLYGHNSAFFFRVYHNSNEGGNAPHTNYTIAAEEIPVEISGTKLSPYRGSTNYLGWSSKYLNRATGDKE
jgi:hypothetical protein